MSKIRIIGFVAVFVLSMFGCASHEVMARAVRVPNSPLAVAVPPNWKSERVFRSNVLSVSVPVDLVINGERAYAPDFRVEFGGHKNINKVFDKFQAETSAELRDVEDLKINGLSARSFWFETEIVYDFVGGSMTSNEIHYEILVEIDGGVLSCGFTASAEEVEANKSNISDLCGSVIKVD